VNFAEIGLEDLDWIDLDYNGRRFAGSYEHGNKHTIFIEGGEFLQYLSLPLGFQEGLCFMQFVRYL
jgi:hypothetical protein